MGKCKDCKWWVVHEADLEDPERDKTRAQCLRYPPRNYDTEENRIQAYFPETHNWEGCGEFKPKGV